MERLVKPTLVFLVTLLMAKSVYADVVWPALYLEGAILTIPVIVFALLIEYFFVLRFLEVSWKKAFVVNFVMNVISTLLGVVLIPLFGLFWEFSFGDPVYKFFHFEGTFNPISWTVAVLMATAVSAFVEQMVIVYGFKLRSKTKNFLWLYLAHLLTVGSAMIVLKFPEATWHKLTFWSWK